MRSIKQLEGEGGQIDWHGRKQRIVITIKFNLRFILLGDNMSVRGCTVDKLCWGVAKQCEVCDEELVKFFHLTFLQLK